MPLPPDPRLPALTAVFNKNDTVRIRTTRPVRQPRCERETSMSTATVAALRLASVITVLVLFIPYLSIRHVSYNSLDVQPHPSQPQKLTGLSNDTRSTWNTLPKPVAQALQEKDRSGYLLGNKSYLTFYPYDHVVDLRIIVIAFDRAASLHKCLVSLSQANYMNDTVSLHVWLDRDNTTDKVDHDTYLVATSFTFPHVSYQVHIQPRHTGIQGQWINTWRPAKGSAEVGLIIEDDLTISPYFWRWLKAAHNAYDSYNDISGYGLSHPGISHLFGYSLDVPSEHVVFLYHVICTWGFSPQVSSWREFQQWFYESEQNGTFQPLVENILPSQWFLGETEKGRQRDLWEMWHIYFTHNHHPPQYTLLLNTLSEGLLAVNRHETGLHDPGLDPFDPHLHIDPLCTKWNESYVQFPAKPPKYGYGGEQES